MTFKRTVLANGVRVLTIPMPSFESATVLVMVAAGSRYESKKTNGISHFLEHMAFKGTEKRPSALAISTLIDGIGGECNAFTSKETTGYYIKSSNNHIDLSLDILSDMLLNSLFKTAEIDKERGVILEELNLYEDTPARKIGDIYERLLYGDTPMGWDVGGEKDIIKTIKREDFTSYLENFYSADNITVVLAGGIDSKAAEELVEKYFGKMSKFDTQKYSKVVERQDKPAVFVKHKKTEQAHIALGVRTVPQMHKHRYPLSVLSSILGGGMSSRLFHEIREKRGLAYYVRTTSEHYQDCGTIVSFAGVDPRKVETAIKVMVEEYQKVKSGGASRAKGKVKSEELKKAKEYIKGHLVLELEDSRSVAGFFASQELLERQLKTVEEVLEAINAVTLSDIEEVASKYFRAENLNLALIGDFAPSTDSTSSLQASSGQATLQRFEKLLTL